MSFFKKLVGGQKKAEVAEQPEIPEPKTAEKAVQAPAPKENKAAVEEALTVSPQQNLINMRVTTKDEVLQLISENLSAMGLVSGD